MSTYSTVEVAELVEVSWDTLNRWIRERKFPVPPVKLLGRIKVRIWNENDVEKTTVAHMRCNDGCKRSYLFLVAGATFHALQLPGSFPTWTSRGIPSLAELTTDLCPLWSDFNRFAIRVFNRHLQNSSSVSRKELKR